jgi:hypothetical protein
MPFFRLTIYSAGWRSPSQSSVISVIINKFTSLNDSFPVRFISLGTFQRTVSLETLHEKGYRSVELIDHFPGNENAQHM